MKTTKKRASAKPASPRKNGKSEDRGVEIFRLRLYVAGQTPKSLAALANLKRICGQHLGQQYDIEVIDLLKNPALAQGDQIVAIPTLVRRLPEPLRKIIGDLSDTGRVLVGLDIRQEERSAARAAGA